MGGPENQARMRMTRHRLEDLTGLLGGKRSIPLQQSGCMPQRNIQCPNGLRSAVQLNIQSIPAGSLWRYKNLTRLLCQIRNRPAGAAVDRGLAAKSTSFIIHYDMQ